MRRFHHGHLWILVLLAQAIAGCQRAPVSAPAPAPTALPSSNGWTSFRDDFLTSYFKAEPALAVSAGRHEFDGQLPDWSAAGIAREISMLHAERERALTFKDSALSDTERFERDSMIARIDGDLFWRETAQRPFRNPAYYIDGLDPSPYLTRNYAPLEQRMRAFMNYERAVVVAVAQIKATLRLPLARPLLGRGLSASNGFAAFYRDSAAAAFADVADPALQAQFKEVNAAATAAMRDLSAWFIAQRRTAGDDFALGAENFARMLDATERVTMPLADLEAVGRADLQRNLGALRSACALYLPGQSLHACAAKVAGNKPAGGAVEGARKQLAQLRAFIEDQGIVSIPGSEEALVNEAPPYNRDNFAYIDVPGPYEKGVASVYYIAPPNPAWPAREQADYLPGRADLLFTSVHEVWPGHFLQFLHSNRYGSMVNRVFVGYAFAEGWAHYAEEMMWEEGLGNGDAETHIGQLMNALLRNVRFISSIGLHTQGMKLAESERLFREEAYVDAAGARQAAARGAYDPAYLNYTMGKLMIRKLREDWTRNRGGRAAWREFHDRFLSYGGPPIPMVRAAMMGSDAGPLF
ncbi:MAG TPA: DUF885 domain-containing protein [Steroidobacteraceae bacterium]|jgi:hypothetical protein|nr:DUF885 domain-containing protein [Steroidobacteraceae bacterium]